MTYYHKAIGKVPAVRRAVLQWLDGYKKLKRKDKRESAAFKSQIVFILSALDLFPDSEAVEVVSGFPCSLAYCANSNEPDKAIILPFDDLDVKVNRARDFVE
jgi:hypothetical protein